MQASSIPRLFEPIVLVHGGAGNIPNRRDLGKHKGTRIAVRLGYAKLIQTGSVLDAVELALRSMELDENFNCGEIIIIEVLIIISLIILTFIILGYGSVLNINGDVETDASIMDGKDLNAGCATLVEDILHPITLARAVMEKSNHTFIGGDGVMEFANRHNIPILKPSGQLVTEAAREALDRYKENNNIVQITELKLL